MCDDIPIQYERIRRSSGNLSWHTENHCGREKYDNLFHMQFDTFFPGNADSEVSGLMKDIERGKVQNDLSGRYLESTTDMVYLKDDGFKYLMVN